MNRVYIALAVCCLAIAASAQSKGMMTSCGDAAHNFTGWWTPNPLVTYQNLTINVTLVPAANANTLNADISIKYEGIPILHTTKQVPCSSLPNCPIVAGKQTSEQITTPLNINAPEGHYVITVNVTNESGDWLVCAVVDTHITHSSRSKLMPMLLADLKRN